METLRGSIDASGKRFAVVVSSWNALVTGPLADSAVDCLVQHGAVENEITLVRVPGAFELPLAAKKLAESSKYAAVLCLGAVIRGDTPHFDYVAGEAAKGIAAVALSSGIPVSFGLLTTDTLEQALQRCGGKAGNKGWEAALAAIEMASLLGKLE